MTKAQVPYPSAPARPAGYPTPTAQPYPTGYAAPAQPASGQYAGYYNQRYYNYQYGIHNEQKQAPQQFSQIADNEEKQRPIYLAIAGVAVLFGLFMIFSAFSQPKLNPDFRAELEGAGSSEVRAIIICDNCGPQLEAMEMTIIANYPEQSAVLIASTGSKIVQLETEDFVKAINKP